MLTFDVAESHSLTNRRLFAIVNLGIPDDIKVGSKGRLSVSCRIGVNVYQPIGELIGEILLPETASFTFGGSDNPKFSS